MKQNGWDSILYSIMTKLNFDELDADVKDSRKQVNERKLTAYKMAVKEISARTEVSEKDRKAMIESVVSYLFDL